MKQATTILVFCVGALLALGMVMLYSSSMVQVGSRYLLMQLVWCALGMAACVMAASIDYRWLKKFHLPWILLALSVALLALVLVPGIGLKVNGARRWFDLGVARFQPSELAKLSLIIAMAWYGERYQRFMHTFWRGLVVPGCVIGLFLGLLFAEPDWGNAMLIAAVSVSLLFIAGIRWKYLIPPVVAGAVLLGFFLWNDPVRRDRILAFLHPEDYKETVGYQAWQAQLALGSGGWTGLGLGNGRQKHGFVPEHHTDFILSVIGEELGLAATAGVVLGFLGLIASGVYIAWRARDLFGHLLAAGITFLIGLQAFINIGVVTGSLPNKGIPLPFISYGGSNLLMMLASVGLLLSVARLAPEDATAAESEVLGEKELLSPKFS